ncbi:MAG: hypothetical protein EOO91_16875 [Pedobacter sp.]|nr:MAG: hypothetical protein EOO91_16875 [Pedobacter sp.]
MTQEFAYSKKRNIALKFYVAVFGFYILISILSSIPILLNNSNTLNALVFYDAMKRLLFNVFYIFIGFNLYKLIYDLKSGLISLIAKSSLKRMTNIWYALVGLLSFKVIFEFIFRYKIVVNAPDADKANELGYSTKMPIAPYADLLLVIFIVWVLMYVLNFALKLKQEQDLTI